MATELLTTPTDFGDWRAEYRAFVESCAVTARPDRGAVRVGGERRAEILNGLLTNDILSLQGAGCHAMLLTPKGRVLTDLRVLPCSDHLLLDVPVAGLAALLEAFKKYLPPIYATFQDSSADLHQIGVYGPRSATAVTAALGVEVPGDHLGVREMQIEGTTGLVVRTRRLSGDGVDVVTPTEHSAAIAGRLVSAVEELGGRAAGARALEAVRVEWGIPTFGKDISDANLAQETGLESEAISYEKGCYLGQEVVARVHFRGHVNRHLRGFRFGDLAPPVGAVLSEGGKEVGSVTSVVQSPEFGPIGLGYARREISVSSVLRWEDGDTGGSATVTELPFRRSPV